MSHEDRQTSYGDRGQPASERRRNKPWIKPKSGGYAARGGHASGDAPSAPPKPPSGPGAGSQPEPPFRYPLLIDADEIDLLMAVLGLWVCTYDRATDDELIKAARLLGRLAAAEQSLSTEGDR